MRRNVSSDTLCGSPVKNGCEAAETPLSSGSESVVKTVSFRRAFALSVCVHGLIAGLIFSIEYGRNHFDPVNPSSAEMDVELDDSPELERGSSNPSPVEKSEWIEGVSKTAPDSSEDDRTSSAVTGNGNDPEGFFLPGTGDRPPTPVISFDLRKYYPEEARRASITHMKVMVRVKVDENGELRGAELASGSKGYGFDEAAMRVVHKIRFIPGYRNGRPARMTHVLPVVFELND